MINENRSKFEPIVVKYLTIILLMGIAIFLFAIAPNFRPPERFPRNVMRLVVDDKDVTNSLPHPVFVEDDVVMMSDTTAMKYFENIYVYYDKKYDTVIITSEDKVAKLKLGESKIDVNGVEATIKGVARYSGDVLYIPISSIQDVTDVEIDYNEKVTALTPWGWSRMKKILVDGKLKLKAYQKELSLTTGIAYDDEILYVFDTEGKSKEDYLVVRNVRGDIGYIQFGRITAKDILEWNQGTKAIKYKNIINDLKYTLVWEYAQNYTPNRVGQAKIDGLHIIAPTWLEVKNTSGDIINTIDKDYMNWAKGQNYQVWPTLKNDYISIDNTSNLSTIMNDMKLREKLINNIVGIALAYNFDGINLDFENMLKEDKNVYSEFVREFSSTLRSQGLKASVDVTVAGGSDTYSLCYDRTAIGKAADYVMLMAYDQYGNWSNEAGPVASLSWVESNIKEMLEYENVDKDKLFLCVPFYSRYWVVNSETGEKIRTTAIAMDQANYYLERYQNNAVWNEEEGQYYIEVDAGNGTTIKIWIENEEALKKKIELINQYDLAGIAVWRWGYEDGNDIWKVIKNTMNAQ